MELSAEAKKRRNEYMRKWRQENPEKVQAAQERFWTKKAMQDYMILDRLGILSIRGKETKEVNIISFRSGPPKLDIRTWKDGAMLQGVSLTPEEREALRRILNGEKV